MAAPTQPLVRTKTVTLANPTPPTNVPVYYQGTPPFAKPSTPHWVDEPQWTPSIPRGEFMDPFNGAVATQWTGTDALPVRNELAGKAEADGTEVTTTVGNITGHSVLGNFTENPNTDHPSLGADIDDGLTIPAGYPNASTTGVQAGITLTPLTGDQTINSSGVYENKLITGGTLVINANDVTVRNCRVVGAGSAVIYVTSGKTGVIIEYCDVDGNGVTGIKGIWLDVSVATEVRFCDIAHSEDGIYFWGSNHSIHDNYIHDLDSGGPDPHHDGFQTGNSTGTVIEHNTMIGASDANACFALASPAEVAGFSLTVNNNVLRPGPVMLCLFNIGDGASNPTSFALHITNNKMEPGHIGSGNPYYTYNIHLPTTWTGNTNVDTGAAIPPPT